MLTDFARTHVDRMTTVYGADDLLRHRRALSPELYVLAAYLDTPVTAIFDRLR